jgi:hypothetical protein
MELLLCPPARTPAYRQRSTPGDAVAANMKRIARGKADGPVPEKIVRRAYGVPVGQSCTTVAAKLHPGVPNLACFLRGAGANLPERLDVGDVLTNALARDDGRPPRKVCAP